MKRIAMVGMAILAVVAIGGANAISVSASGHEFGASTSGKTVSHGTTEQRFKTSAGTIECETVSGSGTISAGKSTMHKEVLDFGECTGFGKSINVSAAYFEYNANGPAKLEKEVKVTSPSLGCELIIEPQTVESLSYESVSGGKLISKATINKVKAKGTGGVCGGPTEASYTGTIEAELEGGTLEWK
ncbi:MAG TPA: hypothetical protein VGY13_00725 [Solirubrobacteraceae bacterium]|jgi:hypothetical protein|nr:hypothetical protein [Solirubrobacteraceae bacterium]